MAGYRRFFVRPEDVSDGKITIEEDRNHIVNVLRLACGDRIIVCTGDGFDRLCEIEEITKRAVVARELSCEKNGCEPSVQVTLFQGLAKGEKMDLIVQKCTELGVTCVVPFESRYTVAKAKEGKTDRLSKIAVEAAKQCGRAVPPHIASCTHVSKLPEAFSEFDLVVFACETERKDGIDKLLSGKQVKRVALVVGSEGGFSEEEIELLSKCSERVSLGTRILRCETAAIALTSVVMFALGEMSGEVQA